MSDSHCPHRADLLAFSLGMLPEDRSEQICQHLELCDDCRRVLEESSDAADELLVLLRSPESDDLYEHEAECQQAMADLFRAQRQGVLEVSDIEPVIAATRQYRLVAKLGAGGMGAVFKVVHTRLERVMALKVLLPDRVRQAEAVARFEREIRLVGQLDHPNIVRPTDAGEEDGVHFLVMEYVDGVDFSALLDSSGPLPIADACELIRQAAVGLQHAHERGVVHRDIKPSNLMVDRYCTVKILDFGVAHLRGDIDDQLTTVHHVMGTLDYMAPEQVNDAHEVDHRADVYGLGATLYKLLCGEAPLAGDGHRNVLQKLKALAADDIRPIGLLRPEVPDGLAAVLKRMLAKDPADRYESAAMVADALAPWSAGNDLQPLASQTTSKPDSADTVEAKEHETYCGRLSFVERPAEQQARGERASAAEHPRTGPVEMRRSRIGWPLALAACVAAAAVMGIVIFLRGQYKDVRIERSADGVKIVVEGGSSEQAAGIAGWPPALPNEAERWAPGPDRGIPSGILPCPASLVGIRHWQARFASTPEARENESSGKVRSVRWSPDGQVLAVASRGGDLYLLSREGLVLHRQLGVHSQGAKRIAWSADGQRLATSGLGRLVRLWDCQLNEVRVLRGHEGGVLSVSWDPVTGRLASGDSSGKIHIWDANGDLLKVLDSEGWVWGLAWSPDGKWLAAQAKGDVRMWDSDLAPGPTLHGDGEAVEIAWNPDGTRLAVACMYAKTVQIWTAEGQLKQILSGDRKDLWTVAWSRDGDKLASAGHEGVVRIWKSDGTLLRVLPDAAASVLSLSFSPDGMLAAADYLGRVTTWDSETGRGVWVVAMLGDGDAATFTAAGQLTGGDPEAIEASLIYLVEPEEGDQRRLKPSEFYTQIPLVPAGGRPIADQPSHVPAQRTIVWSNGPCDDILAGIIPQPADLPGILRWQIRIPEPAEPVVDGGPEAIRCARWTPDGELLAVASGSGHLHLFAPDGRLLRTVRAHTDVMYRIAWSADGQRLASTGLDGTVRLWTRQLDPICILRQHQAVTLSAAWDPVTSRLATADNRGLICIWDADGGLLGELKSEDNWVFSLAWSPDGKWLASDVGLWDGALQPQPPLPHETEPADLAWSPDGRWLAGAYRQEHAVRLWNSRWEPGPILGGHTKEVWGLAWSHDGQTLASASDDASVRIWRTDGKLLHDLHAHAARVWTLSFAPDGTLVSGSYENTAIAWDANSGEPRWIIALLKDGRTATFTAAGQLTDGNLEAVDEELVYVIETKDRELQYLKPSEFFQRVPEARLARGT